ncbi:MAG: beta-ketoacyl synthase N-terminal-like domain-containing protein, partial [Planctomycetota bacterium]
MESDAGNVVITGLGPVSSIGVGAEALWSSLAAGRSNIQRCALPVDLGRRTELVMAAMPAPDEIPGLPEDMAFLESEECGQYRDLGYAVLATELALADAGIEYDRESNDIGVIQAFEAPGVERAVAALFELMSAPLPGNGPPPVYDLLAPYFYNMQAFLYVHLLGKALGLHGFSTSVHNACSSGAFALEVAAQRIRSGAADVMVVAGGEAFDTAVRLEWFRRLEMYARDERMCPFDTEPSGFYVGEGAAAIVLESAAHAAGRGAEVYAEYLGGRFAQQGW